MRRGRRGSERHVVFVCLVFHPDSSASSLLFTDLFRHLSRGGTRVTVLCGFPTKDSVDVVRELPRRECFEGIEIRRCGVRISGKGSLAARALAYGSFLAHAGWQLARLGRGATVVGGTDPPFTAVALWFLSLAVRFQYQCLLLDVYPDGLVAVGSLGERSPVTRLWRALNRRSYARAQRLLVIGRDTVTLLQRRYGVDPTRVQYIPHWGTAEVEASAVKRDTLLQPLGLHHKFVVQYSGNMGLWHDIETFVRAADLLRTDPRVHFLFAGKGMRRRGAEQLSRDLALPNVTWLDFVPREELPRTLAGCDAALISFRAGLEGVAVPSKLYGILASGRAVLAQVPEESEVAYAVRETGCGAVVPPGDAGALAEVIRGFAGQPDAVRQMGARSREAYRSTYTIDHALDRFRAIWELG